MTPRSLAMVRFAAVILVASASLIAISGLRPSVPCLFPPAVRSHDRAERALARWRRRSSFCAM